MTLVEKLQHIQCEMKAPKNLYNSFGKYKYRNAEGILEAFKPYEEKYRVSLIVSDEVEEHGTRVYVRAVATLRDVDSSDMLTACAYAREAAEKKGMDDSQITGAASSYARKYALNGLFLLDDTADADTDEQHVEITNRTVSRDDMLKDITEKLKSTIKRKVAEKWCDNNSLALNNIGAWTDEQIGNLYRTLNV